MEYYNPNDNSTKRYAAITTLVVLALFVIVACFISITVIPSERSIVSAVVEVVAPPEDKADEEKKPIENRPIGDVTAKDRQTVHQPKESPEPKSQASKGEDKVTENVQPQVMDKALFVADVVGTTATDAVSTCSNAAQSDTKKDSGDSGGSDSEGDNRLSEGLRNRGLARPLGEPEKDYDEEGIVVLRVTVAPDGRVINAEPTILGAANDSEKLRKLAKDAALDIQKTMFNPSDGETVGTITYDFNITN
ncbi:MAG: hypothetical protein E7135_01400 [Rikenellaceae bacterium]|nr:hypothetical protein [Rikenellaceae bacterium]